MPTMRHPIRARLVAATGADDSRVFKTGQDVRYFLIAFFGGFTFFSAMIF